MATILRSADDDTLKGTPRADVIIARGGHDTIPGRGGSLTVYGHLFDADLDVLAAKLDTKAQ